MNINETHSSIFFFLFFYLFQTGVGSEMKTLKADVEFKLNTLLSNIESPDSAISDDEKIDTKKDKVK